jgi:hypothetical protein
MKFWMKNISERFMVKNILAIVCIAVAVGSPLNLRAQAAAAPAPHLPTKALSTPGKASQKHPLAWHPIAAQRALRSAGPVAATTPSAKKRYLRKKSLKPVK